MKILLDTNILCRTAQANHSMHSISQASITHLRERDETLCLVPQVLYEYWSVATRAVAENGLGMDRSAALKAVEHWTRLFTLLLDERGVFSNWLQLMRVHDVRGKVVHDSRLVAAMQRHGLTHLLTFNGEHFKRFTGITVIDHELSRR